MFSFFGFSKLDGQSTPLGTNCAHSPPSAFVVSGVPTIAVQVLLQSIRNSLLYPIVEFIFTGSCVYLNVRLMLNLKFLPPLSKKY